MVKDWGWGKHRDVDGEPSPKPEIQGWISPSLNRNCWERNSFIGKLGKREYKIGFSKKTQWRRHLSI